MSFAFMPFYTGDYLRDTRHLTPSKHGIYCLLLMHCWDQRGPLPLEEQECAGICNCRSADEVEALRYVLGRFFTRMDDGWYNRRMMREVEKAAALSDKKSTAGKIGASVTNSRKRKDIPARARQVSGTCSADARHEPHTPTTTTTLNSKEKDKTSPQWLCPVGVTEQAWQAWIEVRKRLKSPMTEFAYGRAVAQLAAWASSGHNPDAIVANSAGNGWKGLFEPRPGKAEDDLRNDYLRHGKVI